MLSLGLASSAILPLELLLSYPIYVFVIDPSSSRITPWLLVVMGIICTICFGALIHTVMEVKRARKASDSK